MLESCSTRSVDSKIRQVYDVSLIRDWTGLKLCTTVKNQILSTSLRPCRHGIDYHTHDPRFHVRIAREFSSPTVPGCLRRMRHCGSCVRSCVRRLIRFHNVHVLAFPFAFPVSLAFLRVAVTGGIVVCSSTGSPTVFRPMSMSATVLASVDICRARVGCAGRTVSSLVVGFAFPFLLTFLERVDLHLVIICASYISSCHGRIRSKVSG